MHRMKRTKEIIKAHSFFVHIKLKVNQSENLHNPMK